MGGNSVRAAIIRVVVCGAVIAGSVWPAIPVRAQRVATTGSDEVHAAKVTVNADQMPLSVVLRTIAQAAGLIPVFEEAALPAAARITLHVQDVSADDAFQRALRGTGLVARTQREGYVVILRAGPAPVIAGTIIGTVTDATSKRPLRGATVVLDDAIRGVTTDDDGAFRLSSVSPGTHRVTIRMIGYVKQVLSVAVTDGQEASLRVALAASANVLDQVVVTGTVAPTELKAVPNAITVITAKQIEERGITKIDQLFRGDVPGLFALNQGSGALLDEVVMFSRGATALMRGANGSAGIDNDIGALTNTIKTYIDGVEMASPKYLSQIDPASIERIEILAGPQASTVYGAGAINGVMQIFTKRGHTSEPQVNVGWLSGIVQNNFSSHVAPSHLTNASVSGLEGRLSYRAGGSWNYAGSWTPGKQTQRVDADGSGHLEWTKLTADLSARRGATKTKSNGDVQQYLTNLVVIGYRLPNKTAGLPTPQTSTNDGQTFGVSLGFRPLSWWSHEISAGSDVSTVESFTTAAGFRFLDDTTFSLTSTTASTVSGRYTSSMRLALTSRARLDLTLGGDHARSRSSSWSAAPPNSLTGNLAGASVTRDHPNKDNGAFIQGQLGLWDALFFTYGVRADWSPTAGEKAKVMPGRYGMSLVHDVGAVTAKLRGSYGRSIRTPGLGQAQGSLNTVPFYTNLYGIFNSILPNPELGPEFQQGAEGGLDLYLGGRGSLGITRYNQTVDNLISLVGFNQFGVDSVRALSPGGFCQFVPDPDGYCWYHQQKFLNVGSIRNQGWEMTGSINAGPFTTSGTYSWTKSRVIGITPRWQTFLVGSSFQKGRPFAFLPEHTWALTTSYAQGANSVSLSVNGISQRYLFTDAVSNAINCNGCFVYVRPRVTLPDSYQPIGSGYATADLNAARRLSARMNATLVVKNLTNYYQNDYTAQNAVMGRQINAGLRIRVH